MTQLSIQYGCSPATGDYGNLTVENLATSRLLFGGFDIRNGAVIYWTDSSYVFQISTTSNPGGLSNPVDGLLEPTEAAGVVTIDTGVAIVNGYLYFSDTAVAFDINSNPGNAGATDMIVLRWTAASQTVRLARINGAAGIPAVPTQTSTVWEIPIAEILLDGGGLFSTLTDVRQYAHEVLPVRRQGGSLGDWSDPGTTNFIFIGPLAVQVGVRFSMINGGPAQVTVPVTFPTPYSNPPVMTLGVENALIPFDIFVSLSAVTASGFNIEIANVGSEPNEVTVHWHAIGEPAVW